MAVVSKEEIRVFFGDEETWIEYRDLHWLSSMKFYIFQVKGQSKYLMANHSDGGRTVKLHQLIMNAPEGFEIDHINHNGLDNRRSNLRIVTHQINQCNLPKQKGARSRYYGVYPCSRSGGWQCQVAFNGKRKTIGRYKNEKDAAVAYNNELIKMNLHQIKSMNDV